jgi:hypothetical protein
LAKQSFILGWGKISLSLTTTFDLLFHNLVISDILEVLCTMSILISVSHASFL